MDHSVVRHAYENTLTAAARLAAFATGTPTHSSDGLIDARQEVLAANDLVLFAVNARRLIETTNPPRKFDDVLVDGVSNGERAQIKLRVINGRIIHHKTLEIVRTSYHLNSLRGASYEQIVASGQSAFSPLVFVQSDEGEMLAFKLLDLILTFEEKILTEIVEQCSQDHLFLDDEMFR